MEYAIKKAISELEKADETAENTWQKRGLPDCKPEDVCRTKYPFKYGCMLSIIESVKHILEGGLA